MTKRFTVAAVFLAGCAVGGVSGQLLVPKASAQQAATLTKWDFQCVTADRDDIAVAARKFGAEAWDMAGLAESPGGSVVACFKRPK